MKRLTAAKEIANEISDYLLKSGWIADTHLFFQRDPLTNTTHNLMTAFQIQFERDLQSQKNLENTVFFVKAQIVLG